ncbi:ABC transporter permease [Beduinella massiliensis]|uniref:ABC transporter permease n=1 Tax=Beduinella massiliensis TaxID=1852363 RepID=UPI0031F85903
MDLKKAKRFLLTLAGVYWVMVLLVYLVAGDSFRRMSVTTDALSASSVIGEISEGVMVAQRVSAPAEELTGLEIMTATYGRSHEGTLEGSLVNAGGDEVARLSAPLSNLKDGQYTALTFAQTERVSRGEALTLILWTSGCAEDDAITLYYGNTVMAGRFDIAKSIAPEEYYTMDGIPGAGQLCLQVNGIRALSFYKTYWLIVAGAFAVLGGYALWGYRRMKQGKNSSVAVLCTLGCRYGFLLKQLVGRDFKTKYKRSALGMAWSFMNPLLTMMVQYIVFSTLFKSSTANYPVYLLSGIVFFNFFSEAVSLGMTSITGNASLIKKVYMPKYIYPVARICSSLINLGLALIPLLLVMLLTGIMPGPSCLLLIFDVLCLLGFVLGMVLLLSTAMTFFQDTQFLWGVVSLMWMYMTPIFYTENIIPAKFLTLYHMNPMYQYITFARICIIDGVSPEPMAYLWCILSSVAVLLLGIVVFKKNQDKFVLQL